MFGNFYWIFWGRSSTFKNHSYLSNDPSAIHFQYLIVKKIERFWNVLKTFHKRSLLTNQYLVLCFERIISNKFEDLFSPIATFLSFFFMKFFDIVGHDYKIIIVNFPTYIYIHKFFMFCVPLLFHFSEIVKYLNLKNRICP